MKNFFPLSWARTCAFLVGTILSVSALKAQLPTSVDIDLVPGTVTNTMDVKLRANGASFAEVLSTLTFTIRFRNQDGTLSPATMGGANTTAFCPTNDVQAAIPIGSSATVTDGTFKYRTYNGFGSSQLQEI